MNKNTYIIFILFEIVSFIQTIRDSNSCSKKISNFWKHFVNKNCNYMLYLLEKLINSIYFMQKLWTLDG